VVKRSVWTLLDRGWILAGATGAIFFLVVAGAAPLLPTNLAWIFRQDDIATAQLGWMFFRDQPWSPRIALNPAYGIDYSGSIIFSDAIPLLSIVCKLLSPILPVHFQYFGIWVLCSFILQGVFGWLLASRATQDPLARLLGAVLISLTPLYCFRFVSPLCAHMSLTAHWIVLAALCLCLPPASRRPWLCWGALLVFTAFVHIYLFAMVATLWCADLVRRALADKREALTEFAVLAAFNVGIIYLSGVWSGPVGDHEGGFGWFKMNALAFLDPNVSIAKDQLAWSALMPDIPNWDGDYEGFAYLGLGGLLLAAAAAILLPGFLKRTPIAYAYAPLLVVAAGMAVFALSHNVTFGNKNFFVPWPPPLRTLGELFRATGRFVWPLYYLIFFGMLLVLARRIASARLLWLLGLASIVQAIDLAPGWSSANAYLAARGAAPEPRLNASFWDQAARRYDSVRLVPHVNRDARYFDVALMALRHGMSTDAVYLSRTSRAAAEASRVRTEAGLATGQWPANTLFILSEEVAERAKARLDRSVNFLGQVDGLTVLAPNWAGCTDCGARPAN